MVLLLLLDRGRVLSGTTLDFHTSFKFCLFNYGFIDLIVCCSFVCLFVLYWISCSLLYGRPVRTEHATIAWIAGAI